MILVSENSPVTHSVNVILTLQTISILTPASLPVHLHLLMLGRGTPAVGTQHVTRH